MLSGNAIVSIGKNVYIRKDTKPTKQSTLKAVLKDAFERLSLLVWWALVLLKEKMGSTSFYLEKTNLAIAELKTIMLKITTLRRTSLKDANPR